MSEIKEEIAKGIWEHEKAKKELEDKESVKGLGPKSKSSGSYVLLEMPDVNLVQVS